MDGRAVYHINVLMCVATDFAMIGLDMMINPARRREIVDRFERSGREVIALTNEQIAKFAGNAIELQGKDGRIMALSSRALSALTPEQITTISASVRPVALDMPTIERAGGSVRCMLAGIHLTPRA